MPVVTVTTSQKFTSDEKKDLTLAVIDLVSEGMKKPKEVIMAVVLDDAVMAYQLDNKEPCAFVNIKYIGPSLISNRKKTVEQFCDLLKNWGIDPNRIFINFDESSKNDWGTNFRLLD